MRPRACVLTLLAGALVSGALRADVASAGAAYSRGIERLEERRLDEAVSAFEEALRQAPLETAALRYRDAEGRHRHAYYPVYALGLARLAQARAETGPYVKRERLQAAVRHFGETLHPEGAARRDEAAAALDALEKEIAEAEANAIPPELAQLRARVDRLCEAANFVEALRAIAEARPLLERFPRIGDEIVASARNRQQSVLRSYETILASRLESLSRTDPTYESEIVLPLLQAARLPAEVTDAPAPRFRWVVEFCDAYEKELDRVRNAATLDPEELLKTAGVFEALAHRALASDLFNGFRAVRTMAHAIRLARLKELAVAAEPQDSVVPGSEAFQAAVARLLEASDAALVAAEAALVRPGIALSDDERRKYVAGDLPYQKRQVDSVRGRIREVTIAYERRVAAQAVSGRAEAALFTPGVMSDPEECRKVARELTALESQAHFETLPAPIRARALFARAVCEAVAAFLEADPPARAAERCRGDLLRAYSLDANVHAAWQSSGRLSPRLVALFGTIRKAP